MWLRGENIGPAKTGPTGPLATAMSVTINFYIIMLKISNMNNIDTIDSNENVPEVLVYSFAWFAAILHRASYIKSLAGYLSAITLINCKYLISHL